MKNAVSQSKGAYIHPSEVLDNIADRTDDKTKSWNANSLKEQMKVPHVSLKETTVGGG